jgi:hypothetical protein
MFVDAEDFFFSLRKKPISSEGRPMRSRNTPQGSGTAKSWAKSHSTRPTKPGPGCRPHHGRIDTSRATLAEESAHTL